MAINARNIDINLVLLTAILGGGGYFLWRMFGSKSYEGNTAKATLKDLNGELKKRGLTPSYIDSNYKALADQIHEAMKYLGTDEDAILSVMRKMNNDADLLKLMDAFGSRDYAYGFYAKNLPQWFTAELDEDDIADINNILKSRKIQYRF